MAAVTSEPAAWVTDAVLRDDALAVVDDGVVSWVSPAFTQLLGWRCEEITGRHLESLTHPADALLVDRPAAPGRWQPPRPRRLLAADGGYRWIAVAAVARAGQDDRPDAVLLRCYDADDAATARLDGTLRGFADRAAGDDLLEVEPWRWLPAALDASPDGFAVFRVRPDPTGAGCPPEIVLGMINRVGAGNYQLDPTLLRGRTLAEMTPAEVEAPVRELLTRAVASTGLQRRRIVVEVPGWESILDVVAARLDATSVVVTWRDVAAQVHAEGVLLDAYARAQTAWDLLDDVVESIADPVLLIDPGGRTAPGPTGEAAPGRPTCVFLNAAAGGWFGVERSDGCGVPLEQLWPGPDGSRLDEMVASVAASHTTRQTRLVTTAAPTAGRPTAPAVMLVTASPTANGRVAVVLRDVTDTEREREQARRQRRAADRAARTDPLTGMPNRLGCETALHQLLLACPAGRQVVVVLCDVGIEAVGATVGLPRADLLLRDLGDGLAKAVPDADVVARLGGGEFVVALARPASEAEPDQLLDAVHTAVERCWPVDGPPPRARLAHYVADPASRPVDQDGRQVLNSAVIAARTRARRPPDDGPGTGTV